MALIKDKLIKGINCPYWKIVDCNVKTGFVAIAPYVNREAAQTRENMMDSRVVFQIEFPVEVSNPLAYAYEKIKESKMVLVSEAVEYSPAVEEVPLTYDDTGTPTNEYVEAREEIQAKDAVYEETNWFADATDA